MKKAPIIFVIIIILVACQEKNISNDSIVSEEATEVTITEPINSVQVLSDEQTVPTYFKEDEFLGEELEIVKIINSRIHHLWEGNESEYMKLINKNSPLQSYPSYKIEKISLRSDITINEHKNVYQAIVSVTEKRLHDNEEHNPTYVFTKDKKDGSKWTILDID
ncbi:hypothetical protein AMS62_10120 [Bacillus sp. FJAT-18019]|nr:hypothetical protein AMS62_10120 [Bacillus sp. FJAT-18019]